MGCAIVSGLAGLTATHTQSDSVLLFGTRYYAIAYATSDLCSISVSLNCFRRSVDPYAVVSPQHLPGCKHRPCNAIVRHDRIASLQTKT
jgi:hypothetical protein